MKNAITGFGILILIIMTVSIIFSIDSRSIHKQEAEKALSQSIENTLSSLYEKKIYSVESSDELINDFTQALLNQIESSSELTVNVLSADYEKGLLSIEVIENFKYPNGKLGKVSAVKTVILDQEEKQTNDEKDHSYTICFLLPDNEIYKSYVIKEGDKLIAPKNPDIDGKSFLYWEYNNQQLDLSEIRVNKDMNITAKFSE